MGDKLGSSAHVMVLIAQTVSDHANRENQGLRYRTLYDTTDGWHLGALTVNLRGSAVRTRCGKLLQPYKSTGANAPHKCEECG